MAYCIQLIRKSLLMGVGFPVSLRQSEEEFLTKFAAYLPFVQATLIADEMTKAYHAIERNGNPKVLFMSMSIRIHRLLK